MNIQSELEFLAGRSITTNSNTKYLKDSDGAPSQSGITSVAFAEGNRNFCHKHKKKYINFCLDHALPLCARCFKEH
jgi:hypothetical protein